MPLLKETQFHRKQGRAGGFLSSPRSAQPPEQGWPFPPQPESPGVTRLHCHLPHLLAAPPRCLQQRTDYPAGRWIKWDPLLAVTTQNNLSPEQLNVSTWHLRAEELVGAIGWHR